MSPTGRSHHPEGNPHVSAPAEFLVRAPVANEGAPSAAGPSGCGAAHHARESLCVVGRERWRDSGSFSWPAPRMRAGWFSSLRNAPNPGGEPPSSWWRNVMPSRGFPLSSLPGGRPGERWNEPMDARPACARYLPSNFLRRINRWPPGKLPSTEQAVACWLCDRKNSNRSFHPPKADGQPGTTS